MRFGAALMLVAMIALLPACAKKSTTENGPAATAGATTAAATPESSVQQATVQTNQGKVVMGKDAVDPSKLGLPVYPGATPSDAGSFSIQGKDSSAQAVTIETHDPFDKVVAFYKANMPAGTQSFQASSGSEASAQFVTAKSNDKSQKQVVISQSNGVVKITLLVGTNQ
ncbi:MAG TPA: hypothetical protein VGX02_08415 [Candidatus Eremiobacteraceae bacterium]|jgi:hypothetical protein|nr:hypothetical protein [Candidatus Eremiobacteraceae bacterium]